jgi:iron(III) transport system permease protein
VSVVSDLPGRAAGEIRIPEIHTAGRGRERSIQYGITLITLVLVIAPLLPILYQSVIDRPLYDVGQVLTLDNYAGLFTSPRFLEIIGNSFLLAALSTVISQVGGGAAAILIGRTNLPGRRIFGTLLLWPLFISSLVLAFGWFIVYGSAGYVTLFVSKMLGIEPWSLYTIGAMGIISGVSQLPLALLYCLSSTANADPTLEDAARSCGAGPLRTLVAITLPLMRPALLYSGVLNFTIALEMLSIPLVFGEPGGITVFTTLLYTEGLTASKPNYGLVGTAAVLLLAIVFALVLLQNRLLRNARRFVTVSGKASRPRQFDLGAAKWPLFVLLAAYTIVFIVLPIGALFLRAAVSFLTPLVPFWKVFTWQYVTEVLTFPTTLRSIWNSIVVGFVGAGIATLYIAVMAVVVHRSDFRFRRSVEYLALFPRAIPGLVAGIGFFYAMVVFPPMGWLANSIWILVLAFTMRYIPTGFGAISPMLLQIGPDLDRSARTMGADWWTTCHAILLRLLKPAMFACFALLFVHFFKEYSTAIFLFAPGSEVLGTTMLTFWTQGQMGHVAALACIQIVLTAVFVVAVQKLMKVKLYG